MLKKDLITVTIYSECLNSVDMFKGTNALLNPRYIKAIVYDEYVSKKGDDESKCFYRVILEADSVHLDNNFIIHRDDVAKFKKEIK